MRPRPRLPMYAREHVRQLSRRGGTVSKIAKTLSQEGIFTCRQNVWQMLQHIESHGTIRALYKCGCSTKLGATVLQTIDDMMQRDDETTAKQLVVTLRANGISLSTTTAQKGRCSLGCTRCGTAYCQLIRAPNRAKRLEWARQNLGKSLEDVIWTDETTVQMESHRHFHCYKKRCKPRYKPRPKHLVKVHVWVGISS